jgi:catechol 2,3-dioxygenase-like lactoylglutathione lyase family enzyme
MHLLHLGLTVRDVQASLDFYASFGFEPARARHYPDGTVIVRNADGFDLALHPDRQASSPSGFLHFGFSMPDADGVRAMLARVEADGIRVVEREDDPDYVGFKCLDPDGWRLEVYWEPLDG